MDTHKNAPLTPKGREAMVRSVIEGGLRHAVAARQFNTTPKTVAKWVERFRTEGVAGLRDRSSRPHFIARPNPISHMCHRRGFAPAALHREADRRRSRDIARSKWRSLIILDDRRSSSNLKCGIEVVDAVKANILLCPLATANIAADIRPLESANAPRAHLANKGFGVVGGIEPPVWPQQISPPLVVQLSCAKKISIRMHYHLHSWGLLRCSK
jgi:transposase-like protein